MVIETAEASLFYNVRNVPGTEPILYLPSALGSIEEMLPIAARFPERTAIFLDFPGHGKSSAPRVPMTSALLGQCAGELLAHLDLPKLDIIGYSLGGYAALELAAAEPNRVRSVASHAMKFFWTPEGKQDAIATFAKAKGQDEAVRVISSVIRDFARRELTPTDIRNSGVPVFLSTGANDEFVVPAEVIRLAQEIGGTASSMIFAGAGHSLRKLSMEEYEGAVREFWGR